MLVVVNVIKLCSEQCAAASPCCHSIIATPITSSHYQQCTTIVMLFYSLLLVDAHVAAADFNDDADAVSADTADAKLMQK